MTTTTGIRIESDVLLEGRRELLRHELSLRSALALLRAHPPDPGPSATLTGSALDRVTVTVGAVADDLRDLADALARLVDDLTDQDGRVGAMFDLLTTRSER